MKDCNYRLPSCSKCKKHDDKECNHNWVYDTKPTDSYNDNGELCYMTKKYCTKCGIAETMWHVGFV